MNGKIINWTQSGYATPLPSGDKLIPRFHKRPITANVIETPNPVSYAN